MDLQATCSCCSKKITSKKILAQWETRCQSCYLIINLLETEMIKTKLNIPTGTKTDLRHLRIFLYGSPYVAGHLSKIREGRDTLVANRVIGKCYDCNTGISPRFWKCAPCNGYINHSNDDCY